MPDFDLPTTDGGRIRKSDFVGRKPLLLAFGSVTCPMTVDADPKLKHLYDEFGGRVEFVLLYVREAHPGDRYPQPQSVEQKLAHARELEQRDRLPFPVAVDSIDGELHERLDPKPNAVYIMDMNGNVAFRSLWANDREGVLRKALEEITRGESPRRQRSGRMIPMMRGVAHMDEMLEASGPTARRDVRRGAPPVYAMARMVRLFRRPRDRAPVA
jgi:Iodothyronine deiodinase